MYQIMIRIPNELKEKLREEAEKRGQTISGVIRQALWDWIEEKGARNEIVK